MANRYLEHGRENFRPILREEYKLTLFENACRLLGKMAGRKGRKWQEDGKRNIQGYSKLLSGYNCPAAIPHQIRETTTI